MITFKVIGSSTLQGNLKTKGNVIGQIYTGKNAGTYVLPPATNTTLGGVIIGDNIKYNTSGLISIETLTNAQIEQIFAN